MKVKKVISTLLVTTMTAVMLAGCGGSGGGAEAPAPAADNAADETQAEAPAPADAEEAPEVEEQVLKVAAFEGGYGADMWSEVVAAFEASHPGVTVELTIDKKLEDVISPSMKAGDYPDVVHLATGREAALTETLTKENALLPLTDVLEMSVP